MDLDEMYANANVYTTQKLSDSNKEPKKTSRTESETSRQQSYRLATVCLGLLCIMQLIVIIALGVYCNKVLEEGKRDQNQLKGNISQLTTSYTAEFFLLNRNYNTCTAEKEKLQNNLSNCESSTCDLDLGQDCPLGWKKFVSKCYFISSESKTWAESQQDCKQRNANLVIINSNEEQEFVSELKNVFWIGLSDLDTEGTWKWINGRTLPRDRGFWESEQPDDHNGNEDCVGSRNNMENISLKWNDFSCWEKLHWICEK